MTGRHPTEAVLGMYALEPSVTPNRRNVGAHLAACEDCRTALGEIKTFDVALAEPDAWLARSADLSGSTAFAELRAFANRSAAEDLEALRLLAEYEDPEAAPRFVWDDIPNKAEYRTGGLARMLCKRANGMCIRKPLYALALAEAAVRISADLPDASYPRRTIHELRGEAWKEQANALYCLGRFADALVALAFAEMEYLQLSHEGIGLTAVGYVRASVFFAQEQLEAADQLATESAKAALHLGATDRYMRAQHLRGEIRFHRGDIAAAVELFASVLQYGQAQNDAVWIARESHNLGICYVELANAAKAELYLSTALRVFTDLDFPAEVIRTTWTIARLTFLQGKPREAIRRLGDVIRALTREGMLTDGALAAVHLAEMLDATDCRRDIPKVLSDVVQTFIGAGKLTGALAALAYLKQAAADSRVPSAVFSHVRTFITRAERQPELLFVPPESK